MSRAASTAERGLDGFEHPGEDRAQVAISALLAEVFADPSAWERATRREVRGLLDLEGRRAGGPFLAAPPLNHEALLLALAERLEALVKRPGFSPGTAWSAYSTDPHWHHQNVLELVAGRLLKRKQRYGVATLRRLLTLAQKVYRVSTLDVLSLVERHLDGVPAQGELREALEELASETPRWRETVRLHERLESLLAPPRPAASPVERRRGPGDPRELLGDVDEPWLDALRERLARVPEDHDHWRGLFAHAEQTFERSRPTKRWLAEAREALEALGDDVAATLLAAVLAATGDLPRGDGPRVSARQLAGPAGELAKALCWLAGALPACDHGALTDALETAAEAFFTRVEDIGARCAKAGTAAIFALGRRAAGGDDKAVAALHGLQTRLAYQAAKRALQRAMAETAEARGEPLAAVLARVTAPSSERLATQSARAAEALTRAEAALKRGNMESGLEGLLEAWRAIPSVALAELVETCSAALSQTPLLEGPTKVARRSRFADVASSLDAAALPQLLEALDRGNQREALEQLRLLARWPADPRLASTLCELFERPPYRHRKTWLAVADVLAEQGDPRTAPRLTAIDLEAIDNPIWREVLTTLRAHLATRASRHEREELEEALARKLDRLKALLHQRAGLSASERRQRRRVGELLAAIYANPDDDDLRRLYADTLLEAGDLRGELINLQLAQKPTAVQRKREKVLLKAHGVEWLGPLAVAFQRGGLVYRRGFPVAGRIDGAELAAALDLRDCPAWTTFERLELRGWWQAPLALAQPALRGLRELHGANLATVAALCAADSDGEAALQPRRLELLQASLGVNTDSPAEVARWRIVLRGEGLPELRELSITSHLDADERDELLASPLGARLERLTLTVSFGDAPTWLADLARRERSSTTLTLVESFRSWRLSPSREGSGQTTLHCTYGGPPSHYDGETRGRLDELLARIPAGTFTTINVAER